jgi:hypothetical protein
MLPYDDHDRAMKLLHSLDRAVLGAKVEAILESDHYETLTVDELFSKLKSSEVNHGVRGKIENLTDSHSLALVSRSRINAILSSKHFSLSYLVSMPDEEFDVLGEDDLTLQSRWFERLYKNQKNAWRSLGMCYRCRKHRHFIADCREAIEIKTEHKHHPRTDHKHRSRNDYKGKNKSERTPTKIGGHKKKTERAMDVGVSDIDSSSCYMLGILETHKINLQAHGYHCSFHLKVFQGYRIQGNVCVLTLYNRSKDTPIQGVRIERTPKGSTIYEIKGRSLHRT